jgi:hypothetical protein
LRLHVKPRSLAATCIAIALTALALGTIPNAAAQSSAGEWAWMGGSSTAISCAFAPPCLQAAGVYGSEYQPAAGNLPGYRSGGATWTGSDGRLWLFGGYGFDVTGTFGLLDDLWAFDPTLGAHGKWAWMGGDNVVKPMQGGQYGTQYEPDAANLPGARTVPGTWTDAKGRLWMFGGYGADSQGTPGLLNDLWVFDPALGAHGEWTWISGSNIVPPWQFAGVAGIYGAEYQFAAANVPGSRNGPICWTGASGRMWLFSGSGYDSTDNWVNLQDLWVFDPARGSHGEWAWMGGPNVGVAWNDPGDHGTEFQFDPANIPSYRQAPMHWDDGTGNLWLFGGLGSDSIGTVAPLNELWTFNPSLGANGDWAWMDGDSTVTYYGPSGHYPGQPGVYGPKYRFDDTNLPGGRTSSSRWTDSKGRLWLLGGAGIAHHGANDLLNDLWVFDPSQGVHGQWAWMGGNDTVVCGPQGCHGRFGVYGTEYTFDPANGPGGRTEGQTWTDAKGNLWLFGSTGYDSAGADGVLMDLWEFRFFTPQSISFAPLPGSLTYGSAPIALAATASSGLPVTYKLVGGPGQLSGPNNSTLTITGGGAAVVINAYQAGDTDYGQAPVVQQGRWVAKAPLTVTADDKAVLYGSAVPALTWSLTGQFVNGDTASVLIGAPALSTIVTSTTPPGTYAIRIIKNTLTAANYLVAPKWGTLTVQPLGTVATPTFSPAGGTYTGAKSVRILDPTATIYYTTDGSTPSQTHGTHYTGPVTVSTSQTLKAIAIKAGYTPSAIASATYTID